MAKQVTSTGIGATAQEAENDALRNAVENVMGTLVDSKTLMEKNSILEDTVYTNSRGFITDYDIVQKSQRGGMWTVVIDAEVDTEPNAHLMNVLTREGIIANNMRNAKIAIVMDTYGYSDLPAADVAANAMTNSFLEYGFQMVDIDQSRVKKYHNPWAMSNTEVEQLARSLQADILVIAKASTENAGDVGKFISGNTTGVVSCKGNIDAKMYIARTGQIIAADGQQANGVDITRGSAQRKALTNVGYQVGQYLSEQVLNLYSGNKQMFELTVMSANFAAINKVKAALNSIRGVKNVNFDKYTNGVAVITMQYGGSPQALYKQLEEYADCRMEMRQSSFNTLTISAL